MIQASVLLESCDSLVVLMSQWAHRGLLLLLLLLYSRLNRRTAIRSPSGVALYFIAAMIIAPASLQLVYIRDSNSLQKMWHEACTEACGWAG